MVYVECSAKTGKGISEIFTGITQSLYSKIVSGDLKLDENVKNEYKEKTPGIRTGFEVLNPESDVDSPMKCNC